MEGFTLTAVFTGIICYTLGLIFGWVFNRLGTADKIKQAFKKGEVAATEEHVREKAEIGEELHGKLRSMRDTLIDSFEAYEQAVKSLDERLAPGAKDQLALDFHNDSRLSGSGEPKQISLTHSKTAEAEETSHQTPSDTEIKNTSEASNGSAPNGAATAKANSEEEAISDPRADRV